MDRPPPTDPASSLERLILQTATALPPPPPGRAPGALRWYQDSLRGHCQIENPGSLVPVRYNAPATSDASSQPAVLLHQMQAVFSVVAPCPRGASLASVRRRTFTTYCSEGKNRE